MRHLAALAAVAVVLTGCSFSIGGPGAVEQAELEKKVVGLYQPDDPDVEFTAECDGGLAAEVDATQDCHISGGDQSADVRVVVTEVGDEEVDFEATPFVPADRVAETIKESLAGQNIQVDSVECEDELAGEVDATTTCTAVPAEGEGTIEVVVTSVDGLMVNFDYEVVA